MDYKKKAEELAHWCTGGSMGELHADAIPSWTRAFEKALTEAHAAGVKEGEGQLSFTKRCWEENAKRANEAEAKLAEWKVACDQHFGRMNSAEKRAAIAEAKLAALENKYEALVPDRDQAEALAFCVEKKCGELRAQNAALISELFEVKVKRGQDIMEFEREKKALTAELKSCQDSYHEGVSEKRKLCAEMSELRERFCALTADAGRKDAALSEWIGALKDKLEGYKCAWDSYKFGLEMVNLKKAIGKLEEALSPTPVADPCAGCEKVAALTAQCRSLASLVEQEREKIAALTAERDAANDEARQMQERLTRVVEGHKALTAEAGRLKEASNTVISCWDGGNGRESDCMNRHIEDLREALAPTEKAAPECPRCEGNRIVNDGRIVHACPECGGTGKKAAPEPGPGVTEVVKIYQRLQEPAPAERGDEGRKEK